MAHPPPPPPLPPVISAVRVLLWVQFGLSMPYVGLAAVLGFFADSYYVDPGAPRGADGDLHDGLLMLFPLVLLAAAPQLAVLAANPAPARPAWRTWALAALAAPLLVLGALVVPLILDARVPWHTLFGIAAAAVLYALPPLAAIACLCTPTARALAARPSG